MRDYQDFLKLAVLLISCPPRNRPRDPKVAREILLDNHQQIFLPLGEEDRTVLRDGLERTLLGGHPTENALSFVRQLAKAQPDHCRKEAYNAMAVHYARDQELEMFHQQLYVGDDRAWYMGLLMREYGVDDLWDRELILLATRPSILLETVEVLYNLNNQLDISITPHYASVAAHWQKLRQSPAYLDRDYRSSQRWLKDWLQEQTGNKKPRRG